LEGAARIRYGSIAFRYEPLPAVGEVARELQALKTVPQPSFFTSWGLIAMLLARSSI
jgi:hypothetical protein